MRSAPYDRVLEFRNSVTFTHILMAMDILYLGYALVHYVKKHGMDRIAKTNIVGIIILFAAFAADIIFFYVISTVVDILGRTDSLFISVCWHGLQHQIPWKNFMKDRKLPSIKNWH